MAAVASGLGGWLRSRKEQLAAGARTLSDNAILVRGLRTRMRGNKAYWLLTGYVVAMGLVMLFVFLAWSSSSSSSYASPSAGRELGRALYYAVFITQAVLIYLVAPALSSGALTLELEQRTYDMLVCTRLTPRDIVSGKILSGWLFLMVLITVSLPLAGVAMLIGGISPGEIVIAYLSAAMSAYLFCAIGVFWSAINTRSAAAGLAALVSVIVLGVLTVIASLEGQATPFTCLSPIGATIWGTGATPMFGMELPNWLIGLPLLGLGCALVSSMAVAKVKGYRPQSQLRTRVLLLVLVWGGLFAFYGALFASASSYRSWTGAGLSKGVVGISAMMTLSLLLMLATGLATGDLRGLAVANLTRRLIAGANPKRLLSGSWQGGLAFTMLLGIGAFGLLGLSIFLIGPLPAMRPSGVMHDWKAVSIMSLAVLLGSASLAFFLSTVTHRIAAGVLTLLLVILAWVGPTALSDIYFGLRTHHALISETLYWSPVASLMALIDGNAYLPLTLAQGAGVPLWVMTTAYYLIAAGLILLLAGAICRARLRRQARAAVARGEAARAA